MNSALIVYTIIINSIYAGIDPQVALSIAKVESNFNINATGQLGEIGIFQLMPMYSKYSVKELRNPETNIKEGIRMLKYAKENCKYKSEHLYVICFNLGVARAAKIRYPAKFIYYTKVMAAKAKFKQTKVAVK